MLEALRLATQARAGDRSTSIGVGLLIGAHEQKGDLRLHMPVRPAFLLRRIVGQNQTMAAGFGNDSCDHQASSVRRPRQCCSDAGNGE
jgi:hypothetical protein